MRTIYINNSGFLSSPYITDADIPVEVSEEDFEKVSSFPFFRNWVYDNGSFVLVDLLVPEILRQRRAKECFSVIDRSQI